MNFSLGVFSDWISLSSVIWRTVFSIDWKTLPSSPVLLPSNNDSVKRVRLTNGILSKARKHEHFSTISRSSKMSKIFMRIQLAIKKYGNDCTEYNNFNSFWPRVKRVFSSGEFIKYSHLQQVSLEAIVYWGHMSAQSDTKYTPSREGIEFSTIYGTFHCMHKSK